jgi:7-carboxy-7-deazaguanine synthase
MRIAELYKSIQGEGSLTGTESVFVRASGCNLRCGFCDTPYASWRPEGEDLSVDEIAHQVTQFDCGHAVITGGEPMLFSELIPLTRRLVESGWHVTIETAGTLYLPVACSLMSISPKMSNSVPDQASDNWRQRHERTRHAPGIVRQLVSQYDYQLKYVIDSPADCGEVARHLAELPEVDRSRVWLMPQGTETNRLAATGRWLEPYCVEHGYRYCPRRQIEWFGLQRGT